MQSTKEGDEPEEGEEDVSTNRKIITFILILCLLLTACLVGCKRSEPEEEVVDYDFSIFFGNLNDPIEIDAMLSEYEKLTGLKINPVITSDSKDNSSTLDSLLKDEEPPVIYAVTEEIDVEALSQGGFITDFTTIDSNMDGNHYPYILNGYGLAYDRGMIEEMFGTDITRDLLRDLRQAEYGEWLSFIDGLESFIEGGSAQAFTVSGNSYQFPEKKGELTKDLNGVYAFAGSDSTIYGDAILNIMMQAVDIPSWESVREESTSAAFRVLDPTLNTYINGLDDMTSHLSGEYSSGIRGEDFIDENFYSIDNTNEIFMEGKAMFSIIDSRRFSELEEMNAAKADRLKYLPIKMPYTEGEGKVSGGAILNRSIPAGVSYSLYINNKVNPDLKKQALNFLLWFMDQDKKWGNSLSTSVNTYVRKGNVLDNPYSPPSLDSWKEKIYDDNGIKQYLQKGTWSEEYKSEFKTYLTEMWLEN